MAAEQAAQVADTPTVVIPTTTIPQGIASMLGFNPEQAIEDNKTAMTEMSQSVTSGQITYSIRDTEIDNVAIKKDDYLGLVNNKIVVSIPSLEESLFETLQHMLDEDSELITLIVGEDGDTQLAERVSERLMDLNDELEIEVIQGNQPVLSDAMMILGTLDIVFREVDR